MGFAEHQLCLLFAVRLESGVDYVQGIVGDMGFSYKTIVDTLKHFDCDAEQSVEWLLEHGMFVYIFIARCCSGLGTSTPLVSRVPSKYF